jgi:cytosine/adenosine deaminase-related metal-dependent hydrolase
MAFSKIYSKYGLLGKDLSLKQNIEISLSKDGKISGINCEEIDSENISIEKDTSNNLLIPGLINSHVHIVDNFAKENGYNRNLLEIVAPPDGLKHKLLRETSKKVKMLSIKRGVNELYSNGITTFMDFREGGVKGIKLIKNALNESDIIYKVQGRYSNRNEIEVVFKLGDGLGLSSYSKVQKEDKQLIRRYKQKYRKMVACHDAENKLKTELFQNIIEDDLVDLVVHGTYYTENEILKLKKNQISLVLCPRSNAYFGVGFPDIKTILKHEIEVSIGTDNFMAVSPNLFDEIRYLFLRAREMGLNESHGLIAKNLLKMITINGAKNLQMEDILGSITEGKYANFNLISLSDSNFFVHELRHKNLFPLLIQRVKPENIKKTIIRGKVVYERNF